MSGGRYHRYQQSHNAFDYSDESSSCGDTCPLHYTKPVSDGEDEATSAATTTTFTQLESMKAFTNPTSIHRCSEDMEEEEEFGEQQASLEKQFVNHSVCPDTRPTHHSKPFDVQKDKDEFTSLGRSSVQPKYVNAPRDVTPISSYSENLDQEAESWERPTSSERQYPTRDRDLFSSPAISVQGSWRQRSNPNSERCEHSVSSNCNRSKSIGAQGHEENRAMQDLQAYAIQKPQETMATIKNCLKVAEETKDAAGETMALLHAQGDQIQQTHETVVKVDQHLTVAEKILGSLGGIFSRKWKPKLTGTITGPLDTGGENFQRHSCNEADRTALGLYTSHSVVKSSNSLSSTGGFQEHHQLGDGPLKQEDALMDLSNVIGQLKDMSLQMHSEISRQNEGITYLDADVRELNYRVKGANDRGRQLLRR
ncbi:unnamed protein product [Sphagnum compactum]